MNDSATTARRGVGVGLVAFLFGVADRAELPRALLNRLLVELGLSDSAAHAVLARMRRDGLLAGTRRGREVDYRLAGAFAQAFDRVRHHATVQAAPWTGAFHALLYQVPESQRAFRDAVRRAALHGGYAQLQPGVLIALTDRGHVLADLGPTPPGARLLYTELAMPDADAAAAAWTAWDLAELSERNRAHLDALHAGLADPDPATGADVLRLMVERSLPALTDTLRDPRLPPELLPPDWNGPVLREVLLRFNARFGPAAHRYVLGLPDQP